MLHFRFVPGCQYYEVDHLNGDKNNNTIWNLEWVTPQENVHRAISNGLRPLSCTTNTGVLLSDYDANNLYNESHSGIPFIELSKKYNVSIDYINGLHNGTIRPYIHGMYYNRNHI